MNIEFDPAKDEANVAKHGISLASAVDLEAHAIVVDDRFDESRYRVYGTIDGVWYCLAATVRDEVIRAISLRRSRRRSIAVMSFKHPPEPADDAPFDDADNPEWTEADFARARPLSDFPELAAAFANTGKPRGRPKGSTTSAKSLVSLRLDNDILDRFRATGPGWQSRINAALRVAKV